MGKMFILHKDQSHFTDTDTHFEIKSYQNSECAQN